MTDEEKIVDQVDEVDEIETEDDAVESAPEEKTDKVIEPIPDDIRPVEELKKDGGLRGIQTPTMIHEHVDNFLAKIAGETPVDDAPRNSKEYWLNEIADWSAGKSTDDASTKKIYCHPLAFIGADGSRLGAFVFNNDPTPIDSATKFLAWLNALFAVVQANVRVILTGTINISGTLYPAAYISKVNLAGFNVVSDGTNYKAYGTDAEFSANFTSVSDGVNAIN